MHWSARTLLVAGSLVAATAVPAAQRTFVASTGDDGHPCSITQPCRSFAAAIAATSTKGEVVVLDSAGYGPVVIGSSVSIIAPPGVYAGVSVFSGSDGIVVDAAPFDKVTLRGLTINGQGGGRGIWFLNGAELNIEDCIISGMTGNGIEIATGANATTITNTALERNGANGIQFMDRASGSVKGLLRSVRSIANGQAGLLMGAGAQVKISDSLFHANGAGGAWALTGTTNASTTIMDISQSVVSSNQNEGIIAVVTGTAATFIRALIADNVVTDHIAAGIEAGVQSELQGGVRAVITNNRVRGVSGYGIVVNRANTTAVMSGNVISQASQGVVIQNSAVVRSRGDNVADDNGTNELGSAVPANVM